MTIITCKSMWGYKDDIIKQNINYIRVIKYIIKQKANELSVMLQAIV